MHAWLIILIVLAVALVATAGFVTMGRGRGGIDLEPPPSAPGPGSTGLDQRPPADVEAGRDSAVDEAPPPVVAPARPSFRERLAKARGVVSGYLGSVLSRSDITATTWDELEEALIRADVGAGLTSEILDGMRAQVKAESITDPAALIETLKADLAARLAVESRGLVHADDNPSVWILVGVNGVGKTTTIGKLGAREAEAGRQVVMVAGDTFRAAAAEQLETWADRCGAQFVRGAEGADPSSVIFDGIEAGAARGADVVLADTAGRLHNKSNLMDELRKVRRVADKAPGEVTEVLLVLDATTGQNGLEQARVFTEAVEVTGVVLTKLDGSAKGGIVLAIQHDLGIPVKFVGLGETATDLVEFEPVEFVDALLSVE